MEEEEMYLQLHHCMDYEEVPTLIKKRPMFDHLGLQSFRWAKFLKLADENITLESHVTL